MADSGLDHARAFRTLAQSGGRGAEQFRPAVNKLAHGGDLAEVGRSVGVFTHLDALLVRAAHESGTLGAAYRRLAQGHDRSARRSARLKAQCLMPLLVLILGVVLAPLPGLMSGQLNLSAYFLNAVMSLMGLGLVIVLGLGMLRYLENTPRSALASVLSSVTLALPVLGANNRRRNVARFLDAFAMHLEAGLPADEAGVGACSSIRNQRIAEALAPVPEMLAQGHAVSDALVTSDVISLDVLGALQAGEAAGRLGESMQRIATTELEAAQAFDDELGVWCPRFLYVMVLAWLARNVLTSRAFIP